MVTHIRDEDLPRLAAAWANGPVVAAARSAALSPDSPLVIEVLAAFEALVALFEDDLRGEADYVTVDPALTRVALKAVRDALAAAYARPVLSRTDHAALMRPWRSVYPVATMAEPDLGPQAERVKALFAVLPRLSDRCHDQGSRALYDDLVDRSFAGENDRADARRPAFSAAVLTSRRRAWALVRRSAAEVLSRPCATCRVPTATAETRREVERRAGPVPGRRLRPARRRRAAGRLHRPARGAGQLARPPAARPVQLSSSSAPQALTTRSAVTPHRCARSQPSSCQSS